MRDAARVEMAQRFRCALLALGSNLGNRPNALRSALRLMQERHGMETLACSSLCASPPLDAMGESYVNAVAIVGMQDEEGVREDARALRVLRAAMDVEREMGRVRRLAKGNEPRPIDIDVLMDTDLLIEGGRALCSNGPDMLRRRRHLNAGSVLDELILPHPRMAQRSFVLLPMAEALFASEYLLSDDEHAPQSLRKCPDRRSVVGTMRQYMRSFLLNLRLQSGGDGKAFKKLASEQGLRCGIVLGDGSEAAADHGKMMLHRGGSGKTKVMGIVNVTPDSFSDGGKYEDLTETARIERVVTDAERMVAQGVDVLDIGGQSTRPGALRVGDEEEARRVVPVIRALRGSPTVAGTPISIDTYSARVAMAAVDAGALIVNDVSSGTMDEDMFRTVSEMDAGVAYIMMHMRGEPTNMQSKENTTYSVEGSVARVVGEELGLRVHGAISQGINAWRIGVDPGLGFAKTGSQSVELMRSLQAFRKSLPTVVSNAPMLVGSSRKSFLSSLMARGVKEAAVDRDFASAASVAACVAQGTDIVRVRDISLICPVIFSIDTRSLWQGTEAPLTGAPGTPHHASSFLFLFFSSPRCTTFKRPWMLFESPTQCGPNPSSQT